MSGLHNSFYVRRGGELIAMFMLVDIKQIVPHDFLGL